MVSVPPSPGWMLAKCIRTVEHLLATTVSLSALPLSVGQATIIFFIYAYGADAWARHYFSKLKLASHEYYTP
jgi:hypothetical protein